ncbi:MAG TPA: sigma-70 family RNA polymerase sigma factor [Bryobacteraceae bacterium]|nr:sigma-70 family RNA polymerase sigma factor [Bryobacteraceae bacterium]
MVNMAEGSHTITGLLTEWRGGNQGAANQLIELVYAELHRIASREMRRERREHTLQTTALVHETYLRLCGSGPVDWKDRAHFFAVAAQQLRRVLVDHARRVLSEKRGGGQILFELLESDGGTWELDEQLLAVDESLTRLQALDERAAKVIELRFFGGLSEAEAAEALNISIATLKRDWEFARTWLASQLAN